MTPLNLRLRTDSSASCSAAPYNDDETTTTSKRKEKYLYSGIFVCGRRSAQRKTFLIIFRKISNFPSLCVSFCSVLILIHHKRAHLNSISYETETYFVAQPLHIVLSCVVSVENTRKRISHQNVNNGTTIKIL